MISLEAISSGDPEGAAGAPASMLVSHTVASIWLAHEQLGIVVQLDNSSSWNI
jgi:hypothetical protein